MRGLPALLAAIGLSTLALLVPLAATPAAAEDVTLPAVQVVIDSLTPVVPTADGVLRIRGRVVSSSRTAITDVSVQLRRSASPLESRRDVPVVLAAGLTPKDGDPDSIALYGTRVAVTDSLAAGSRKPFELTIPLAELALATDGTYVLGVEALGREDGVDTVDVRKGITRTFLPWYPDPTAITPISLVWLWPLADWPARTASGVLLNDRTPVELSPGGRLDRLLSIGDRFRGAVSWVVDPALLQTASAMTGGYQVMRDGEMALGDREQQARQWLERLADATRTIGIRALPYADIDASAVNRAGMSNDVVRAITQGPGVATAALGMPVPGDLYWAPFGRLDRSTVNVLASSGVTEVILSSDAMPPTDEAEPTDGMALAALPASVGAIHAVLTDPGLSEILTVPRGSDSEVVAARQQFLAETALIAASLPADQGARTVVVAPSDVRWDPTASLVSPLLRAARSAAWLDPATLRTLVQQPVSSTSRQRGGYGDKAREAELSQRHMESVRQASADLDSFTSIIDDPTGISEPFSAALLRSESAAWRSNPATGESLVGSIEEEVAAETARVRVLSEGTITFSGDTGRVPVTITNDLDRSVTVGLMLEGRPPLRLESEPLASIRVEAGRMASVDIDARVVGGDPLTVSVQLLGPDGAPYGEAAPITVSSTAYARAAAWVVAGAFLAILVFVIVGVTRRIHAAQTGRSGSGTVTP